MNSYVIISNMRSGTTFLADALNSHKDIDCFGEILGKEDFLVHRKLPNYIKYMEQKNIKLLKTGFIEKVIINNLYDSNKKVMGIKIMYPQISDEAKRFISFLGLNKIKVIHLIRTNQLDRIVSRKKAHQPNLNSKIDITKKDIQEIYKSYESIKRWKNWLKTKNVLEITYNELFEVIPEEITHREISPYCSSNRGPHIKGELNKYIPFLTRDKICGFLGVETNNLFSKYSKREKRNTNEVITSNSIQTIIDSGLEVLLDKNESIIYSKFIGEKR